MTTQLVYQGKEKRERKSVIVDGELEKIYKKHKVVTVEVVLQEASKPTSPLHSYFEWDDVKAGRKYRYIQAYSLIMASKFVVSLVQNGDEPKQITRANVRKLVNAFRGEGFKMRVDALKDSESRIAIIESKRSQLRSWCESVTDIEELSPVRSAILAKL